MRKGNFVRVATTGPRTNTVRILRPTTPEEREAWYETDAAKGMNEAGETKLPPMIRAMEINGYDIMVVERARCAPNLGWNKRPGMTKVRIITGKWVGCIGYIKRDGLEIVAN